MLPPTSLLLSGERFIVTYHLTGNEAIARAKAEDICIEQTVEFPAEFVPDDDIRGQIFGRIEDFRPLDPQCYIATISFAVETSGFELAQLLNVIYGNISIKPGIRVDSIELPHSLLQAFKGPRFGRAGMRQLLNVAARPLLCTALKPMGYPIEGLAEFAYQLALGGIDMIKDDHGLADQPFANFRKRVKICAEAIERVNHESGYRCIYMPNVTGPVDQILDKALYAKEMGAGALLLTSGLTGPDMMRLLADDDRIALPLVCHPAFTGSYVITPDNGFSHYAFYGQLTRLIGADAIIYPNYGGRFSFSREACQAIAAGCSVPMGHLQSIFPAPGGGMSIERLPDMQEVYGNEVIYLIGGALHKDGNLIENARQFRALAETCHGAEPVRG